MTEGVLLVGYDGRVELLNPAAEAIFGVDAEAVRGKPGAEAVDGWAALVERAPVGRPGRAGRRGGRARDARRARAMARDRRRPTPGDGVVYTIRDVTADRRLEELRSDLVAIVSHELRTPLTGVYGAAQTLLARDHDLDEEQRRTLLEMLVEQTRRLATIVDQILLTSRIDSGQRRRRRSRRSTPSAVFETARPRGTAAGDAAARDRRRSAGHRRAAAISTGCARS